MTDELDAQIDLAENFLRAGNINRAEKLCKEVLEKRHDDRGAFLCLFDVHVAQNKMQEASDLCDWRINRRPECPDSHLCKLVAFGTLSARESTYDHILQMTGENFMSKIRLRLANYPLKLAQAEILHNLYFKSPQETLKRIDQERIKARLNPKWLDNIESSIDVHIGNTVRARTSLKKKLAENPQDAEALYDLAVTDFFSGKLFSAMKHAKQAKQYAPEQSAQSQEVIIASIIGLLPPFWIGQIIITLTVFITRSLEDYIAWPLRFGGVIAAVLAYSHLAQRFVKVETASGNIMLIFIILIGVWAGYITFYFGEIGSKLSERKSSIKISKKY